MGRAEFKLLAQLGGTLSAVQAKQGLEHYPGAIFTRLLCREGGLLQSQLLLVAPFLCRVGRGQSTRVIWLQLHLSACRAGLGVLTWQGHGALI